MRNFTPSGMPRSRVARRLSTPASVRWERPVTLSARKFALRSQTTLSPPNIGMVSRAWTVEEQISKADSELSAMPSMVSWVNPSSTPPVSWL